jgi:molecular chaperone DnaK (HSP70)
MPPILAIDLGARACSVGLVIDGIPTLLPVDGLVRAPSVVHRVAETNELLLGKAAVERFIQEPGVFHPELRSGSPRRLLRPEDSLAAEEAAAMAAHLVAAATTALGGPHSRIVLVVPDAFPSAALVRLRESFSSRGLEIVAPIPESIAIAIAQGQGQELIRKALVVEWGASGLRASYIAQDGLVGERIATTFDPRLSMVAVTETVLRAVLEKASAEDPSWTSLARAPTHAPAALWGRCARFVEEAFFQGRADLLIARLREPPPHVLRKVSHERRDVEGWLQDGMRSFHNDLEPQLRPVLPAQSPEILLAGGFGQVPMLTSSLYGWFGRPPVVAGPAEQAAILGAACFAARMEERAVHGIPVDLSPHALSFSVTDRHRPHEAWQVRCGCLVHEGAPLPARGVEQVRFSAVPRVALWLQVFAGGHPYAPFNVLIGQVKIPPGALAGASTTPTLDVVGVIEADGRIRITASEPGRPPVAEALLDPYGGVV